MPPPFMGQRFWSKESKITRRTSRVLFCSPETRPSPPTPIRPQSYFHCPTDPDGSFVHWRRWRYGISIWLRSNHDQSKDKYGNTVFTLISWAALMNLAFKMRSLICARCRPTFAYWVVIVAPRDRQTETVLKGVVRSFQLQSPARSCKIRRITLQSCLQF